MNLQPLDLAEDFRKTCQHRRYDDYGAQVRGNAFRKLQSGQQCSPDCAGDSSIRQSDGDIGGGHQADDRQHNEHRTVDPGIRYPEQSKTQNDRRHDPDHAHVAHHPSVATHAEQSCAERDPAAQSLFEFSPPVPDEVISRVPFAGRRTITFACCDDGTVGGSDHLSRDIDFFTT